MSAPVGKMPAEELLPLYALHREAASIGRAVVEDISLYAGQRQVERLIEIEQELLRRLKLAEASVEAAAHAAEQRVAA